MDSEGPDQTVRMRWLISTFAVRICRKTRFRMTRLIHPVKIQIILRIRAVWSESSLDAFWTGKYATLLHYEDPDQTVDAQADLSRH